MNTATNNTNNNNNPFDEIDEMLIDDIDEEQPIVKQPIVQQPIVQQEQPIVQQEQPIVQREQAYDQQQLLMQQEIQRLRNEVQTLKIPTEERVLNLTQTVVEKVNKAMEEFENKVYDALTEDISTICELADTDIQYKENRNEASLETHINTTIDTYIDIAKAFAKRSRTVKHVPYNAQSIGMYDRLKLIEECHKSICASIKKPKKLRDTSATLSNRRPLTGALRTSNHAEELNNLR